MLSLVATRGVARFAGVLCALRGAAGRCGPYPPLVLPVSVRGARAAIDGDEFETLEPRLFRFFTNFAHDNALQFDYVENTLAMPQPRPAMRAEPREPV